MRIVVQRVTEACVKVRGVLVGKINRGFLIFLGISKQDGVDDIHYLVNKIINLRIFEDENKKMNLSAMQMNAEILVVSQFTLYGDCRKGRRPSFDQAADPTIGEELYVLFVEELKKKGLAVATGQFRSMMEVASINDGPVTFIIDSK